MTEDRFQELLNLHLDHEATPAESAELETELQRSPVRRRHYRDYCRMQRACAQIFEEERAAAPASCRLEKSLRAAERKAAAPARRLVFPPAAAFAGLGALAACVVFVLVRQNSVSPVTSPTLAVVAPALPTANSAVVSPAPSVVVAIASDEATRRPTVSLASHVPPPAGTSSLELGWHGAGPSATDPALRLMTDIALPAVQPVVVDDIVVRSRPVTPTLQASPPASPAVEFISFQFQR
jgi:anti-sigma factor RsiW